MNLDIIASLQTDFREIYDENFKLIDKTRIDNFNKKIEEVGISSKLTPKEIELKLQQIYETLIKVPNKTTLNKDESEQFIKEAEQREANIKETREGQTKAVEDFIKRNQEQVSKAQAVQEKLKDKVVYAKVIIPDTPPLNETEQKDLEILKEFAQGDEVTRTKLIDDLATKIESKLENVPEEQKILIARTAAVEIVEKLAKPEVVVETQVQTALLRAVSEDKTGVLPKVLNQDDDLLLTAKRGSTLLELENRNSEYLSKNIAKNIFGPKLAEAICGSTQIQIILSETKIEGQTTHQVNLGDLNQNQIQVLNHQNELLNSAQQFGINKIEGFFTNQSRVYLAEKIAKMPAGSVIKKAYSSPITQTILARYGLAQPVVWETVGHTGFVKLAMQIAPDTAGPMLSLAGKALGKEFVKPIVGQTVGKIAGKVATDVGVKVGLGALLVKGAAAIGVSLGVFTAGISTLVTAAIMAIGKAINWPKVKKWFRDNKMLFGLGASLGVMGFFGPTAGLVAGLGFLGLSGSLGAFAMGAFGVFGFIGRSIGIAIATPVIVTLLVLPPLVAFIMLVINNSAYVVPPSLNETGGGKAISPYIDIVKTASPAGPLKNTDLPKEITYTVTIKAKKSGLNNVKITDSCQIISRTNVPCPSFNIPTPPTSISPTAPYIFTYTGSIDASFSDSVVINTINVTADTVEQGGATTETSSSITIGKPPISCPLPGGKPLNSMNPSYNASSNTGHGSTSYWGTGGKYRYALPQSTSCMKPSDCPYYGYAYDVFPNGTTEVFAPTVLGKDVTWNCSYAFSNGGGKNGYTFHCTSSDGNYLLVLTHMNKNAKTGTINSGGKIGVLYNQQGNTHLHLEFQLAGKWQKPENYFCK
jgi:hypothetical protein